MKRRSSLTGVLGAAGLPALSEAVQLASSQSRRPALKIKDIPTPEILGHGYQVHVRVYTDQELFGHGEATDAARGAVPIINSFKRFLVGEDSLNVDFLSSESAHPASSPGAQGGQYIQPSRVWRLRSGISQARLWDCRSISFLAVRRATGFGSIAIRRRKIRRIRTRSRRSRGSWTWDLPHTYYVLFAPHCVVSPIGTMASCHVCAAVPNFLALEWNWIQRLDLWKNFVKEGDIIENGFVTITDSPGLGVEMDEDAARKAQVPNTPWFAA